MTKWIAGLAFLALAQGVASQDVIRLKNGRAIRPGDTSRRISALAGGRHYIVQFGAYPGAAVRAELERRHIRVVGFVPDSALMVTGSGALDLEGLGVTWAGPLEAEDKISPLVARA